MGDRIQLRRGTTEEWVFANPILQAGEPGYETSTQRIKLGNGVDRWSELGYIESDATGVSWGAVSGKPSVFPPDTTSLATVATSGNYAHLAGIPSEFVPSSHKASHAAGGSDALAPSDIGAAPAASPTFTGAITVSATSGSAGSYMPSLTFQNDPNTGFGSLTADSASIFTAGTERLRVASSGEVQLRNDQHPGTLEIGRTNPAGTAAAPADTGIINFPNYNNARDLVSIISVGREANYLAGLYKLKVANSAGTSQQFVIVDGQSQYIAFSTNDTERLRVDSSGRVGIGSVPTAALDINADKIRLRTAKTPASATDTGNTGDICWDSSYIYVCVATNTWRRIAHSTW